MLQAAAATKLQAWTAQIPGKPAVCSITACSSARWMADGNLDYLLLTRCSAGQPPLVLQVPVADFERAAQVTNTAPSRCHAIHQPTLHMGSDSLQRLHDVDVP